MGPIFELNLNVLEPKHLNLVARLSLQMKQAIVTQRLKAGVKLPSTRNFAKQLGISRNSAVAIYDQLVSEGLLHTRQGSGTYVYSAGESTFNKQPTTTIPHGVNSRGLTQKLSNKHVAPYWRTLSHARLTSHSSPMKYDFLPGKPDMSLFPHEAWRQTLAKSARKQQKKTVGITPSQGHQFLREQLALHQSWSRAISAQPDDFIITSGAQQAFDLIAKVLVRAGKTNIAVESPGYPLAKHVFESYGANIIPIPVDQEGMCVESLPAGIDVIYCTPSHQFPLGMAMSANRRRDLLDYAKHHQSVIIEDDYDSEFRLGDKPIDALKSLDTHELVFYVGTFSKNLIPDIRLGFMIAPEWARDALCQAKLLCDWHNNGLLQDTLASFIQQGRLSKHINKMRRIYRQRYHTLTAALCDYDCNWLSPLPAYAGVHLAALVTPDISAKQLAASLKAIDVSILSIADFTAFPTTHNGLIFGYGNISHTLIPEAIGKINHFKY